MTNSSDHDILQQLLKEVTDSGKLLAVIDERTKQTEEHYKKQDEHNRRFYEMHRDTSITLNKWKGALAVIGILWLGLQAILARKLW